MTGGIRSPETMVRMPPSALPRRVTASSGASAPRRDSDPDVEQPDNESAALPRHRTRTPTVSARANDSDPIGADRYPCDQAGILQTGVDALSVTPMLGRPL
jgi:hypothetical protein